jgi:hypothetical protein
MEEYTAYTFCYCPVCMKEVMFFLFTGSGINAYLCRYYQTHRKEINANLEQHTLLVRAS